MRELILSELFGPTIQGEGPSTGRIAGFVRLGLCNLDCDWCDTPYTWDWTGKNGEPQDRSALTHATPAAIASEVRAMRVPLVVITGGEPMVQARPLAALIAALSPDHRVEIETNGTLPPPVGAWAVHFNVSPKLSHSGVAPEHVHQALRNYGRDPRATFKFVLSDVLDLPELDAYLTQYSIEPWRVWVMPEGRTGEAMTSPRVVRLAEACIARRYNVSSRLHVLLWNDARGR